MMLFLTTFMAGTIVKGSGIKCEACGDMIEQEKVDSWLNDTSNITNAYPLYCHDCTTETEVY